MPLYVYCCDRCGDFCDWRTMSASEDPVACPICGDMAQRVVTAPAILAMDPNRRNALARNEKSAHEPKVVRAEDWKPHGHGGHERGDAHGHHHHHHCHKSSRPWMIGH